MPPSLCRLACNRSPPLWRQFFGASGAVLLVAKPLEGHGVRILVARRLFGRFAGRLCCYRGGKAVEVTRFD